MNLKYLFEKVEEIEESKTLSTTWVKKHIKALDNNDDGLTLVLTRSFLKTVLNL